MQAIERQEAQTETTNTETRTCVVCAVAIGSRQRYCKPCGKAHTKAHAARYRRGLNMAPGERSVTRAYAANGLREIAARFQVTRQRVQQIERVALLKMRRALLPFLQEHDPVATTKLVQRETREQRWVARTAARRQLTARQTLLINQMRELAQAYELDGQLEIANEIRTEIRDLQIRLEQLLRGRSVVT